MECQKTASKNGITVIACLNRGSFGIVYSAVAVGDSRRKVALKEVRLSSAAAASSSLASRQRGPCHENEAEIQSKLDHGNIVKLLRYWKDSSSLYMVFEWMECNLTDFLKEQKVLELVKKTMMLMLLQAVKYIHEKDIMHRDINPQNILITHSGTIKLGDFGLARELHPNTAGVANSFSSSAGTREYRAPELLFGCTDYDHRVDLWSCGCTCAEIYTNGVVLLQSDTDIGQIGVLLTTFGDPLDHHAFESARQWPDYGKIFFKTPKTPPGLSKLLPRASVIFLDFLNAFLCYDPQKRVPARAALDNRYFRELPLPCSVQKMPRPKNKKCPKL